MLKIAVIDSGIDFCNRGITIFEDENQNIVFLNEGYDFDVLTHGNVVAQTIGQEDCELYSVKIFHNELNTTAKVLCSAIKWCIDNDINIINISAGLASKKEVEISSLYNACQVAYERGIVIIAACEASHPYPSKFDTVLAVQKNNNLKRTQYQIHDTRFVMANGEVEYVNVANKSRGGLNGSSFSCAMVTRIVCKMFKNSQKINLDYVIDELNKHSSDGIQSNIDIDRIGVGGLVFLNNTNSVFVMNQSILNFNIKYLYLSREFYRDINETCYNIVNFDLDCIFGQSQNLDEIFKPIDTVIITKMDFIKESILDWQEKLVRFILKLADCEKNVICFEDIGENELEQISTTFMAKNKFIVFTNELRTYQDKNGISDKINRTLLLTVSRINDGAYLECYIKDIYRDDCAILSTNCNSRLIDSNTIFQLYNNQYYNYDMKQRLIDANIIEVEKEKNIEQVYLSLDFPILQYKMYKERNKDYIKFLTMALVFEPDNIIVVANQQDDIQDIISSIQMIEVVTSKKVNSLVFSKLSYCESDNNGYRKYAILPSNDNKLNNKVEAIRNQLEDIEILII